MRLTDADALKQTFCAECDHSIKCEDCDIDYHFNHAPTVDAVEVVRCKECRFHEHEESGMVWCPNVVGSWIAEDGFCSMGERREDDD